MATPPSTTISQAKLAEARLTAEIAKDRKTALYFIEQNGGCKESSIDRCIANMLSYLEPDSPAIRPAIRAADKYDRDQLVAFYAAAKRAEDARAAEQARLEAFYKAAAEAKEAEATAIAMGESLVDSVCLGNGGTYVYWTNPPRAEVTSCNAPRQVSSGSGGRTGAVCVDGWISEATGSGACSHHGGVAYWTYG